MDAISSERAMLLLARVLAVSPAEREAFLQMNCGDDAELFRELMELLGHSESAGDFMQTPLPQLIGVPVRNREVLPAGSTVANRYVIGPLLAESGFATVYSAQDNLLAGKQVVVKVLDRIADDSVTEAVFKGELSCLAALNHPQLVGITDGGRLPSGIPYLILTYAPGVTLRSLLGNGRLPVEQATSVLLAVARAVSAAHAAGVLHLDLKPENILVAGPGTPDERITVVDFGISRIQTVLSGSHMAGSPPYMAPEQRVSPGTYSDIYSLGLLAHELYTGRLPGQGLAVPKHVGRRRMKAILKAIALDPKDRWASVDDFARDIALRTRISPVFATTVLLAAVLTGFAIYVSSQQTHRYARPVPLVTTDGPEYRPSLSPDGKDVSFAAGGTDHMDLFRKSVSGTEPVRLTTDPANDDEPQISPDNRVLAFVRMHASEYSLLLLTLDGSQPERELGRAAEYRSVSWSPDGNYLAVAEFDPAVNRSRLKSINVHTGEWHVLMDQGYSDDNATVSPDGRHLAFVRKWAQQSADLCVVELGEGLTAARSPRRLTDAGERIDAVQWTPDSREILYLSGPLGKGELRRIPRTGGKPSVALSGIRDIESFTVALNRWTLAYAVSFSDSNIWRYDLTQPGHNALTRVISGTYDDEEARLSPDGKRIVFASSRSGEEQIWIADAAGTQPRQITSFRSPDSVSALWTPDSRTLVISVRSVELGERIYTTPADGQPALRDISRSAAAVSFSRDGKWLYIARPTSNQRTIWRRSYPTGDRMEPVIRTESRHAAESPDGEFLYYSGRVHKDGLWQRSLVSGKTARVSDWLFRRTLFAPASSGVYFIGRSPGSTAGAALWLAERPSGKLRHLHTFDREPFWGFDLSPDERSILLSLKDVDNSDIMLVGDFR